MHIIDLNGQWQFKICEDEQSLSVLPEGVLDPTAWMPATVPGTVHTDLLANGKIVDPFYRNNELKLQWIELARWSYRKTFTVEEHFLRAQRVELVAQGLDTYATIFINNQQVGKTDNMFIPHRLAVKNFLRPGENIIEIHFDSPTRQAKTLETEHGVLAVPLVSYRVYIRKAQCHFGWDWGPRFPTSGIWRPIALEARDLLRIVSVFAQVEQASVNAASVQVKVEVERYGEGESEFHIVIARGERQHEQKLRSSASEFFARFDIDKPELWWPSGLGEQPLYTVQVTAIHQGQVVDTFMTRFGIRMVELVQEPARAFEPDVHGKSFLLRINGEPIFCKGANWIPVDSFIPRFGTEKYRKLLEMAKAANMNMLRVWGGGIYEEEVFYETCDELGLMVWQDFMFACGSYPEANWFLEKVKNEAHIILRRLRNHPSIVLWCGNNENEWFWWMKTKRPFPEMPGYRINHEILPHACRELDPTRPYWPSSPFGGDDPNDASQGDRHQWDAWGNWRDFTENRKDTGRFLSEFGFQAPAHWDTFDEVTAPEDRWPQSKIMEHHNKQVEGTERLFRYLAAHYRVTADYEDFIYKCQLAQAEALKFSVEHWRRRKFLTAGTLYWQLNDCWPVTSWSSIDYRLRPKAAYYYTKRFFAPVLLSLVEVDNKVEVWISNDRRNGGEGIVTLVAEDFEGQPLFRDEKPISFHPAAAGSQCCWTITKEKLGITESERQYLRVVLRVDGEIVSENALFFERCKHLAFPARAELRWELQQSQTEGRYILELSAARLAKSVCLRFVGLEATVSDNFFDIWPKTTRHVEVISQQPLQALVKALKMKTLR